VTPAERRAGLAALCIAALLGLAGTAAYAVDPRDLGDPKLQARYGELTHELRCLQCQAESIADSTVPLAGDLRRQVAEMLQAGKSDDDVRAYMTARYGDFILFRPRLSARNLWLWGAPGLLVLIGAGVAWRIVRQRAALLPTDNEPVVEDDV
jgi:cytochrome c-type biogenesis protein CcmH